MKQWSRGLPRITNVELLGVYPALQMGLQSRVRSMHHWIRKGEPDKAYGAALEVFRVVRRLDLTAALAAGATK